MSDLQQPHFQDPEKAREYLEALRWPEGPTCPHCGGTERIHRMKGKATRPGLLKCGDCRKQFTVTVGTVFERSKIGLHKWLLATYLLCASKKGISSHQLHRMLGVTYKTAWFMSHRIREAMREPFDGPMGSGGEIIEADETYIGGKFKNKSKKERRRATESGNRRAGSQHMESVVTLVERGGRARSFHVERVNMRTLRSILWHQLSPRATLMTDDASHYKAIGRGFNRHESVNHTADEYVRGDAHSNSVESYFALLKRGLGGIYQHVSSDHLKRYLAEFDFRYTHRNIEDAERADEALRGIEGKRLTYAQPSAGA